MGLTIDYGLRLPESAPSSEVEGILLKLSEEAGQMQHQGLLTQVSDLRHFSTGEIQAEQDNRGSKWQWAAIQSSLLIYHQSKAIRVAPIEGYLFRTWFGPGCEEANFGLMRYPPMIEVPGEGSDEMQN